MYGTVSSIGTGASLVLFILAWTAGRQAARLAKSGSAARLHRKTRRLLIRTCWLTVPAVVLLVCVGWMMASVPAFYWEDLLLLNVPLIGAPLLAVWFTTVPMLWEQWTYSRHAADTLDASLKSRLHSRLFTLPYQATALGAAVSFYFGLASSVPYDPPTVSVPLAAYVLVMAWLWLRHDRRFSRIREWIRAKRMREDVAGSPIPLPDHQAETQTRA